MAKPDKPLFSFGARGTVADTLTFQKRGRLTIARRKPVPTDRKTDLQQAQRQVYRDAVTAWNLLTTEEKEAYRGVCPGLTPYQCYMKSELKYVPPEPPPEEQIEEQTQENAQRRMYAGSWQREGQRLFIPNRRVTKLAFILYRDSSGIAEPVTFTIRKVDGTLIISQVWGNQIDLPETPTWEELEFDTPPTINEEARIGVEFPYGTSTKVVSLRTMLADVKPGEYHCEAPDGEYTERTIWDCAYRYKFYEVE